MQIKFLFKNSWSIPIWINNNFAKWLFDTQIESHDRNQHRIVRLYLFKLPFEEQSYISRIWVVALTLNEPYVLWNDDTSLTSIFPFFPLILKRPHFTNIDDLLNNTKLLFVWHFWHIMIIIVNWKADVHFHLAYTSRII